MAIVVEKDKTVGIWYVQLSEKMDLLGGLNWVLDGDAKHLHFDFRFRHYNSPDPYDPKDKKSWYSYDFAPNVTAEQAVKELKEWLGVVGMISIEPMHEYLVSNYPTFQEFFEDFTTAEFAHASPLSGGRPGEA